MSSPSYPSSPRCGTARRAMDPSKMRRVGVADAGPAGDESAMTPGFASILYDQADPVLVDRAPEYFADLNLDQLQTAALAGRDEYDLAVFFRSPLTTRRAVTYRHQVLQDLENPEIRAAVVRLATDLREVRAQLSRARHLRFALQSQIWHLSAARSYLAAVHRAGQALGEMPLESAGLNEFSGFVQQYRSSGGFAAFEAAAGHVQRQLDAVTYRLRIHHDKVQVSRPVDDEPDYAEDVTATFNRFRQGPARSYRSRLGSYEEMDHVEAEVAVRVAKLYPDQFAALAAFHQQHGDFVSATLTRFDREVQFYLAWLDFADRMRRTGLRLCYPEISSEPTPLHVIGAWDAALADKLVSSGGKIVVNDVQLLDAERIWVVTGPNQGGKTTYARMIGQLHYLASLGLTVPGDRARLQLADRIFTHFERGENLGDLTGKLDDDLRRIRDILAAATPASLLVINEIFTSTTADDAVWLGRRILARVAALGCRCVCVTFLDEFTELATAVSLVSDVAPDDPGQRTFKICRRPADGRAYADAVAERYGLSARALRRRLRS